MARHQQPVLEDDQRSGDSRQPRDPLRHVRRRPLLASRLSQNLAHVLWCGRGYWLDGRCGGDWNRCWRSRRGQGRRCGCRRSGRGGARLRNRCSTASPEHVRNVGSNNHLLLRAGWLVLGEKQGSQDLQGQVDWKIVDRRRCRNRQRRFQKRSQHTPGEDDFACFQSLFHLRHRQQQLQVVCFDVGLQRAADRVWPALDERTHGHRKRSCGRQRSGSGGGRRRLGWRCGGRGRPIRAGHRRGRGSRGRYGPVGAGDRTRRRGRRPAEVGMLQRDRRRRRRRGVPRGPGRSSRRGRRRSRGRGRRRRCVRRRNGRRLTDRRSGCRLRLLLRRHAD